MTRVPAQKISPEEQRILSFGGLSRQIKSKNLFKFFSERSEQVLLISFYVSVPARTFVPFDSFAVKIFRSHVLATKIILAGTRVLF